MTLFLSDYETNEGFDGDYTKALIDLQNRLAKLQDLHIAHNKKAVIVFEGWGVAGKDGAIKRMSASWDPRYYKAYPIMGSTQEEKEKHFLWRFWNRLPREKEIIILDRSYYGRVLRDRVEGNTNEMEWRRGYDEINEFEAQQGDIDTKIIKIFLHMSPKAQEERLKEYIGSASERWKISEDDFLEREKRDDYYTAIEEMFANNDTRWAPWKIINSNDQKSSHIAVLEYIASQIEGYIPQEFPEIDENIATLAAKVLDD